MLRELAEGIKDNAGLAVGAVADLSEAMAEEMTFEPSDFSFDPVDYTRTARLQVEPTDFSFDNQAYNGTRKDTEEIISVIFAAAQQIIKAINEDTDVNIDGYKITKKITDIQDQHQRMYRK